MKLRDARFTDAPEIAKILAEREGDSRYAGKASVDEPFARKFVANAIGRHGGRNDGATFVMVAVDENDVPQAFIIGALCRIYHVFDRLAASDLFLLGRSDVSAFALDRLFDRYIEWASSNPKVYEIGGSWADTIPGAERFAAVFERKGFTKVGEVYSLIRPEIQTTKEMAA